MSIRAFISFDVQKEERYYHVLVPNGAPYAEAREALMDVVAIIDAQEKASKEQEAEKPAETPAEVVA